MNRPAHWTVVSVASVAAGGARSGPEDWRPAWLTPPVNYQAIDDCTARR